MVDGSVDGMMFVTDGDDKDKSRKTASGFMGKCWICKQTGHQKTIVPSEFMRMRSQKQ
jgi:hypothetical protein